MKRIRILAVCNYYLKCKKIIFLNIGVLFFISLSFSHSGDYDVENNKFLCSVIFKDAKENNARVLIVNGIFVKNDIVATIIPDMYKGYQLEVEINGKVIPAKLIARDLSTQLGFVKITKNEDIDYSLANLTNGRQQDILKNVKIITNKTSNLSKWYNVEANIVGYEKILYGSILKIIMPRIAPREGEINNFQIIGSSVLNEKGECIGIISIKNNNFMWLIPSEAIEYCLKMIEKYDGIKHAWYDAGLATNTSIPTISQINPGSPSQKAGLKVGDIIHKINGKQINDIYDLMDEAFYIEPEISCSFEIIRNGSLLNIDITPKISR